MSDALPPGPEAPATSNEQLRDTALKAFEAHAQQAQAPLARARSAWRRRIEPWVVAIAVLFFVAWALRQVFGG
jgi:hypothetical protein